MKVQQPNTMSMGQRASRLAEMTWAGLVVLVAILFPATTTLMPGQALANVMVAKVAPAFTHVQVEDRNDIQFRKLLLSEGLSQTRVSQIIQDDDGYLWFGTQHGVSRYDGYGFHVFKHVRGDRGSLSGVFIYALFKDSSGTIWVGSDQFLDAFDNTTGTFRHYSVDESNPTVIHISEDRRGFLWLATSQGLYRLDRTSGETKRFGHDQNNPHSLSSSDIKSTGEDREGVFWVASSGGLEAFDRDTGQVQVRIPLRQEVREFSFHEDSHGVFWIIYGSGNGLGIYDRKTNTLIRYAFEDEATESGLSGVFAALETTNGDMWFATMGAGLLKFDRENERFIRYRNDPSDARSLAENRAIALFEDREGNIWTGLHATPPNVFPSDAPPFLKVWPFPGHVDKLGESLVNTIFEDRDGAVWIGAGGALNRIDPDGKTLQVLEPLGAGTSVEVLAITQDTKGTLWIGTLGAGLYSYDPSTGQFTSYRYSQNNVDGLSSDIVTRIHVAESGDLWLTTWNGLDKFDPATGKFTTYKRDPASSAEAYFSIVPDGKGSFWLGTTAGLVRFDPKGATFTTYKHTPGDNSSLSNNTVNSLYLAPDGKLWIGTQNGLNKLDTETGKFEAFFDRDGLAGNAVSCLLSDGRGDLWMSTNRGVSRMDRAAATFQTYSASDGLPGEDLTGWNACANGGSDRLYFGGFTGATVKIHDDARKPFVPPVVFTEIQAGNLPAQAGPATLSGTGQASFTLPYSTRNMTISFSALSFRSPDSTRYRYRLEGLDTNWHSADSNQRTISYAVLPPGDFTLTVQAATTRGDWNMPGAGLKIMVLPPWWDTWWFYGTTFALPVAALATLYRYRVAKVAAQYRIRLEERVGERNRVARDLHDTLLQSFQGLTFRLQAARHLLPKQPEEAARMLDLVLEKSDDAIIEGRNAVQALRDTKGIDTNLVEAVRTVGQELASAASVVPSPAFRLDLSGRPTDIRPNVQEEVYRITSEALRNAFKHAGASLIKCQFDYDASGLKIRVCDDGLGIVRGAYDRAGKRWGMAGMKERAEKIGADLAIESTPGEGTSVELTLKARPGFPWKRWWRWQSQ